MATMHRVPPAKEAPTPLAQCPMTAALRAVGGKWSLICLYFIDHGVARFNEIRRSIPEISHKVLTETLRNLEEEALIVRTVHSLAPSHVEYRLSEHGQSVRPLIDAVRAWGRQHLNNKTATAGSSTAPAEPAR